ncbi:hypothetical protein [Candidatus Erwinia haradaeae]
MSSDVDVEYRFLAKP